MPAGHGADSTKSTLSGCSALVLPSLRFAGASWPEPAPNTAQQTSKHNLHAKREPKLQQPSGCCKAELLSRAGVVLVRPPRHSDAISKRMCPQLDDNDQCARLQTRSSGGRGWGGGGFGPTCPGKSQPRARDTDLPHHGEFMPRAHQNASLHKLIEHGAQTKPCPIQIVDTQLRKWVHHEK